MNDRRLPDAKGWYLTADPDLLIRTLGAHRLPLTRLDLTAQHG